MTPTKPSGISAADAPIDHSRREALKRFGRYAAAAPAAMVLLEPRESLAKKASDWAWAKAKDWPWAQAKDWAWAKEAVTTTDR